MFLSLRFYTCLLSSVLILLLGLLNDVLWFVKRFLKVFSVSPTYVSSGLQSSVVTVA